ncbi:hypothetical protein HDU99_003959, partial [Rhizoclosmatium hyalinum]
NGRHVKTTNKADDNEDEDEDDDDDDNNNNNNDDDNNVEDDDEGNEIDEGDGGNQGSEDNNTEDEETRREDVTPPRSRRNGPNETIPEEGENPATDASRASLGARRWNNADPDSNETPNELIAGDLFYEAGLSKKQYATFLSLCVKDCIKHRLFVDSFTGEPDKAVRSRIYLLLSRACGFKVEPLLSSDPTQMYEDYKYKIQTYRSTFFCDFNKMWLATDPYDLGLKTGARNKPKAAELLHELQFLHLTTTNEEDGVTMCQQYQNPHFLNACETAINLASFKRCLTIEEFFENKSIHPFAVLVSLVHHQLERVDQTTLAFTDHTASFACYQQLLNAYKGIDADGVHDFDLQSRVRAGCSGFYSVLRRPFNKSTNTVKKFKF